MASDTERLAQLARLRALDGEMDSAAYVKGMAELAREVELPIGTRELTKALAVYASTLGRMMDTPALTAEQKASISAVGIVKQRLEDALAFAQSFPKSGFAAPLVKDAEKLHANTTLIVNQLTEKGLELRERRMDLPMLLLTFNADGECTNAKEVNSDDRIDVAKQLVRMQNAVALVVVYDGYVTDTAVAPIAEQEKYLNPKEGKFDMEGFQQAYPEAKKEALISMVVTPEKIVMHHTRYTNTLAWHVEPRTTTETPRASIHTDYGHLGDASGSAGVTTEWGTVFAAPTLA